MTGQSVQEPRLQALLFAVGTDPYCVYDWDLQERNVEFLERLDPKYFDYIGEINEPMLGADDPEVRQRAATAIRAAYHHGLESFFALLFSTLQAPWCEVAWMQVYKPAQLRQMVRAVDLRLSRNSEQRRSIRAFRERLLPYIWLRPRSLVGWKSISKSIHHLDIAKEEAEKIQHHFGDLWHKFAKDLVDDDFVSEYNSVKHGLRTGFGGFSMSIALQSEAGTPASPESAISLGESEHGSHFFTARTFVDRPGDQDQRARLRQGAHFRIRRQSLNWDARGLRTALKLISASIHNVRALALCRNGHTPSELEYWIPDVNDFNGPLGQFVGIQTSTLDSMVLSSYVEVLKSSELREHLIKNMNELRQDWDPNLPSTDDSEAG